MGIINIIVYPFAWIMRQVYLLTGSYGLSIIAFTLATKIILLPFAIKQQKNTLKNLKWQPRLNEIREKYKDDREKMNAEIMRLQQEGYSPFGGCGTLLMQMPVIIILYQVVRMPLTYLMQMPSETMNKIFEALKTAGFIKADSLAKFGEIGLLDQMLAHPDTWKGLYSGTLLDPNFLGMNLVKTPTFAFNLLLLIPIISGITSYIYSLLNQKLNPLMQMQQSGASSMMTMLMGPGLSVMFSFMFPAGMGLYWIIGNIVLIGQMFLLNALYSPKKELEKIKAEEEAKKLAKKNKKKKKYVD